MQYRVSHTHVTSREAIDFFIIEADDGITAVEKAEKRLPSGRYVIGVQSVSDSTASQDHDIIGPD